MSAFIYRPHIDHGDRIVTTDFLIYEAFIDRSDGGGCPLPSDLLNSSTTVEMRPEDRWISAVFRFSGDTDRYQAPALVIVDGDIFEGSPLLAQRNARIFVSRLATVQRHATREGRIGGVADRPMAPAPRRAIVELATNPVPAEPQERIEVTVDGVIPVRQAFAAHLLKEGAKADG